MTRTWFITGTSSGFGRQLTEQLLARGDRVAATARRPEALDDLAARYGDQLWRAPLDVTDTTALREVVNRAFAELGRVDVIVSNAGYGLFGAPEELTDEQIDRQIATNLTASIQLARAATPHLRRQGGGRYIQIASVGGQIAFPGMSLARRLIVAISKLIEEHHRTKRLGMVLRNREAINRATPTIPRVGAGHQSAPTASGRSTPGPCPAGLCAEFSRCHPRATMLSRSGTSSRLRSAEC